MTNIIWHPLNDTHPDIGWRYLDTSNNLMYPWYTFGCLEWLNTLDLSDMSVFEYGCGTSTLWWNSKVKKCKGVDNNLKWANGCYVPLLEDGSIDKKKYTEACLGETYDIIIIDGIYRNECVPFALQSIKNGGYLIWDNWDQVSVSEHEPSQEAKFLLNKYECKVYKEPNHIDWKTAVFCIK
jgi:hypothetical protein